MSISTEKVLVIKLGALGDFIQATGPMAAIRRHHKDAHITLLTTNPFKSLGEKCGYFDEIMIDKRPKAFDILGWLSLKKSLNNHRFTHVYDLQNNDRTSLYFKLFNAPKPQWAGVAKGASHRNTSPERIAGSAFQGHQQTLGLAGISDIQVDTLTWLDEDISKLGLQEPYVVLVPGCSPQHPYKRWPAEHYAKLADALIEEGKQVVLIGTNAEKESTDYIAHACPKALNLTGKTSLFQIVSIGRNAYAAIGNDTGPMHMIGPTGTASLVFFSKHGNPKKHAPNGANVETIQKDDIATIDVSEALKAYKQLTS